MKEIRVFSPRGAWFFIVVLTFIQQIRPLAAAMLTGVFDPSYYALSLLGSALYAFCFFFCLARLFMRASNSTRPYSDKSTVRIGWLLIILGLGFSGGLGPEMPLRDYSILLAILISGAVITVLKLWRYQTPKENTAIICDEAVFFAGEKVDAFFPASNKSVYRLDRKCVRLFPKVELRFIDGWGIADFLVSIEVDLAKMRDEQIRHLNVEEFTIKVNDAALRLLRDTFKQQPISYAEDRESWNRRIGFADILGVFVEYKWPRDKRSDNRPRYNWIAPV